MSSILGLLLLAITASCKKPLEPYYGRNIGDFLNFAHGVRGSAYAVDESTIFIKGFSYDGTGPDAFFWIGNSSTPSPDGTLIPYPDSNYERDPPQLTAYNNTDIILRLPTGKKIRDIRWLSVWCRRFTVNFGEICFPSNLEVPKPRVLPEFKRLAHSLRSDNISILDAKTFYIPNLHYDGAGPDAYFWVGNGSEPSSHGIKVPNELGSLEPLHGYQGDDIEIQLPGTLTVYDIDWLAVWCVRYRHNFGHVFIPKDLDVPPALGQTKISPPWWYNPTSTTARPATNCREFLDQRLQVKWEMKGELVEINLSAKIKENEYIAFGISGAENKPQMIGGDITVAFYDKDAREFKAIDYYMSHISQCDGKKGVCPDERIGGRNDVSLIHGERNNGITSITYSRPLQTNEANNDRTIPNSGEVSVIAAFGPINSNKEANAHSVTDKSNMDSKINFGQFDDHQCTVSLDNLLEETGPQPWAPAKIIGETSLTARIGPTGGNRGYSAITGNPSWGICWYINDMLVPEITVERGETYIFTIEGGSDEGNPARYHPFYITDSIEGGYGQKNAIERQQQNVFAGVAFDKDGYPYPTAYGKYCEWSHINVDKALESKTFLDYKKTLRLECDQGESGILNWTVPLNAPDLLYYQCYTHNNLGWKINVVDPRINGGTTLNVSDSFLSSVILLFISSVSTGQFV